MFVFSRILDRSVEGKVVNIIIFFYGIFTGILKMPDNLFTETKKGVEKAKFSLSLNRNNAKNLNNENSCVNPNQTQKLNEDKENKPVKRPLKSTYFITLNAAKRLKPLTEEALKHTGIFLHY